MKNKLQDLLLNYIREHHPLLLQQLLADDALHAWVLDKLSVVDMVLTQSKPYHLLEAECMELLTADLRPHRLRYIRDLFEERFTHEYEELCLTGSLHYELTAMAALCKDLFDEYPLIEGMEYPHLDQQVVQRISKYLLHQYQLV